MSDIQVQQQDFLRNFFQSLGVTIKENPMLLVPAGAAIAAASLPAILAALGFGATGVGPGTLAAAWQSSIGNVASGSLFSSIQSISMSRAIVIPAGIGLAAAAFIVVTYLVSNELSKNEDLRKFIEQEVHNICQAIGGFAVHVGGEAHKFITSPEMQSNVQGAMVFAGGKANDFKNAGEGLAKNAMHFFGWM